MPVTDQTPNVILQDSLGNLLEVSGGLPVPAGTQGILLAGIQSNGTASVLQTDTVGRVVVTGAVTIPGVVTVTGSITIPNTIAVTGAVTITPGSSVQVVNTLSVNVVSSPDQAGTGSVSPKTGSLVGGKDVSGNFQPFSVTTAGVLNVTGSFQVVGIATVTGSVGISGVPTITGSVAISQALPAGSNTIGNVQVANTLSVNVQNFPGTQSVVDASTSGTGSLAPRSASFIGGKDPNGNLQPLATTAAGFLFISGNVSASFSGIQAVSVSNSPSVFVTNFPSTQSITNTTIAGTGSTSPFSASSVGGFDGVNLRALSVDTTGKLNVILSQTASITGSVSLTGTSVITGTVGIVGVSTITGSVTVNQPVSVTGSVGILGVPVITGSVGISGVPTITGSVGIVGIPTITGSVSVNQPVTVTGSVGILGVPVVTGSVGISGIPTITGSVTIPGVVTVTGSVNVNGIYTSVLVNQTLTTNGATGITLDTGTCKELNIFILVNGPVTGTGPTLVFTLNELDPNQNGLTGNSVSSATITSAVIVQSYSLKTLRSNKIQLNWTVGGSSPSFGGVYVYVVAKQSSNVLGLDGTTDRSIIVDSSGRQIVVGPGTAGSQTGGILTVQGDPSGSRIPVTGAVAVTNIVTVTGSITVNTGSFITVTGSVGISGVAAITGSVAVTNVVTITGSITIPSSSVTNITGSVAVIATNFEAVDGNPSPSKTVVVSGLSGSTVQAINVNNSGSIFVNNEEEQTFVVSATGSAIGNNKSMLALFNSGSNVTLRIREVWIKNVQTSTVTGIVSIFEFFRFTGISAGTILTSLPYDTQDTISNSVTSSTGGTVTGEAAVSLFRHLWSSDEWGTGASDVESLDHALQSLNPAWRRYDLKEKAITLRANQGMHIKHTVNSTAGTFDIIIVFTQT